MMATGVPMSNRFVEKLRGFALLGEDDVALLEQATERSRCVSARQDLIREGAPPPARSS